MTVEFEPIKLVNGYQLVRFVEYRIRPFSPDDNCRLKTRPFVFIGRAFVKVSCSWKVLLDTKLTLFVNEQFPPKLIAYEFTVLVPERSITVCVQLV